MPLKVTIVAEDGSIESTSTEDTAARAAGTVARLSTVLADLERLAQSDPLAAHALAVLRGGTGATLAIDDAALLAEVAELERQGRGRGAAVAVARRHARSAVEAETIAHRLRRKRQNGQGGVRFRKSAKVTP